jgi:hypothetical protein
MIVLGSRCVDFTQWSGRAEFLRPCIWCHVSGLMRFHDGPDTRTASVRHILCISVTLAAIRQTFGEESMSRARVLEWKCPNSPRPKKARKVKSKVKSMLVISFDIKGIVLKELVLVGQTANSAYCCGVLRRLCGNVRRLHLG